MSAEVTQFSSLFTEFFNAMNEFDFLRQALIVQVVTGFVTAPLGVLLVLRRMSLMGDAVSHGLLPGVALSYFFFGLSIPIMMVGGFFTGALIVYFTVWSQKHSPLKEDSSFAAFYLLSLALGVLLISQKGGSTVLLHLLFGSPLTVTKESLFIIAGVCALVTTLFWFSKRLFLIEIFDPTYLKSRGKNPFWLQTFFLLLVVGGLVVSFQSNGTLLAMGQLIFPAIIARMWTQRIHRLFAMAILVSCLGSSLGLFVSFHLDWPLGPSTLLLWGSFYLCSLILNPYQGLLKTLIHQKHYGH